MIKVVIFDCFGVLTADKWKEFVGTIPDALRKSARDINHAYDAGFINEEEFISQIKKLTGRDSNEVEAIEANDRTKNTKLLNYIATLKSRYKIGLLSNVATNWIREEFLTPGEQTLFDEYILSYEVQLTKPDPRIFNIACEKLGVQPNEAVLVDDIESYCEAAREVGLQAICYKDFAQMQRELEQILAG
jgi:epoxide hydrolase-like predicted phosphatase